MASGLSDNLYLNTSKPIDSRGQFNTIEEMRVYREIYLDDGRISYCKEDEELYQYKKSNSIDEKTGRWRKLDIGSPKEYNGLPLTTHAVGALPEETDINGMNVEEVVKNMLISYKPPQVKFDISPQSLLYEHGDMIYKLDYIINLDSYLTPITMLTIKNNDNVVQTFIDNIEDGVMFFTDENANINETTEITIEASDGVGAGMANKKIIFAYKLYYGFVDSLNDIDENSIKAMNSILLDGKEYEWKDITCDDKKLVIAYAAKYGDLEKISDGNGFNYISTYDKQIIDVEGVSYNVYVKKSPITLNNYKLNLA